MIRKIILDAFRSHGKPVPLDQIAMEVGISFDEFSKKLLQEPRLMSLDSVSMKEAGDLIEFYGRDALFAESLVSVVEEFLAGRKRIEAKEKRARDAGWLPPDEGK